MVEDLLTQSEIQTILEDAKNPDYSNPQFAHLGSKKTSINGVSKKSGLILIYGNDSTGSKHITERHCLTSRKPYWNDRGSIGNPTKFRLGISPQEYLKLASQIFKSSNKNDQKNNRPSDFDLYIGDCIDANKKSEYKLLTYKGTGIIHSFFLNDNKMPYNKKKILNLKQGWCNASHNYMNCIQTMEMPYFDINNIQRFKIIIRHLEVQQIERWYIQVNSELGVPIITTFVKENKSQGRLEMVFQTPRIDFSNITWSEKIIKQIQDGKYVF